jgi:hypothetical protein
MTKEIEERLKDILYDVLLDHIISMDYDNIVDKIIDKIKSHKIRNGDVDRILERILLDSLMLTVKGSSLIILYPIVTEIIKKIKEYKKG